MREPRKDADTDAAQLSLLLAEVTALRDEVKREGASLVKSWGVRIAEPAAEARALNLGHYVALRGHDLIDLQYRLAARGLSSLGRSEARVIPALEALIATLRRLTGEKPSSYPAAGLMRAGLSDLDAEAERLFGAGRGDGPRARILATLPPEAADDPGLAHRLVEAGMDCARINCAHDDAAAWARMIENIRVRRNGDRSFLPRPHGHRGSEMSGYRRQRCAEISYPARGSARYRAKARPARRQPADLRHFVPGYNRPARSRRRGVHRRRQSRRAGDREIRGPGGN